VIDPQGVSCVVSLTGGSLYSDEGCLALVAFPQTISAATKYYSLQSKTYTLSAKFSGNENANGVGLTLAVFIGDNSGQYIQVGPLADQAPDSATYRSVQDLIPVVTRVSASMDYQDSSALSNGTDLASFQRLEVKVTAAASDLRMLVANYYWGLPGLNQITVTAAIETATATYPLTFAGKAAAVLDPDAALFSDPGCVPVIVAQGDALFLRTYVSVASAGQKWPISAFYWQIGAETVSTTVGDKTTTSGTSGAGALSNIYVRAFAPAAVLGVPA
jgi:hypothetical protein